MRLIGDKYVSCDGDVPGTSNVCSAGGSRVLSVRMRWVGCEGDR